MPKSLLYPREVDGGRSEKPQSEAHDLFDRVEEVVAIGRRQLQILLTWLFLLGMEKKAISITGAVLWGGLGLFEVKKRDLNPG